MTKKGAVAARTAAVKRRTFTREFKLKVIREIEAGKSQAQVAREYQITENTISKWRRQHRQYQDRAFAGRGHGYTDEARMHELERMVGRLTMENDFLKKLLQNWKARAENRPSTPATVHGTAPSTSGRETDRRAEPYQAREAGRALACDHLASVAPAPQQQRG